MLVLLSQGQMDRVLEMLLTQGQAVRAGLLLLALQEINYTVDNILYMLSNYTYTSSLLSRTSLYIKTLINHQNLRNSKSICTKGLNSTNFTKFIN